jgi:predicted ATP-dependent serine protease
MAYYCEDCSYGGKQSGQLGECPACGSFKLIKLHQKNKKDKPAPTKWRLALLVALWGYLIGLIIWKLTH